MKHYHAKELEFPKPGFTDLFILNTANYGSNSTSPAPSLVNDFSVGFTTQNIVLTALNKGDAVLHGVIDLVTPVTGPTGAPTAQVKTSSGAVAITPTATVLSGNGSITDNTVVGRTISGGSENLVLALAAGGGNGAAATAGELWVWVCLSRNDRLQTQA